MEKEVKIKLTPKQSHAFRLLTNSEDLALLYGGAKGGGKDFLFCVWVKCWAEHLIRFFDLKPSKDPIALGFIGRKRSVDFRDTTLEEFKRIIPPDHYRLHNDAHEIIFWDTAKLFCGGLDEPGRVEKFNSSNYAMCAINQAEECDRQEVAVLRAALRLRINGKQPPYKELYTANPGDNWLRSDFVDAPLPHHYFVPALYTDNPHLPADYRNRLETAFRHNDSLLRAYRDGDWSALQASNTLINDVMLSALKGVAHHPKEIYRIVSCDPSLGGDACVIYVMECGAIIAQRELHDRDTMRIAGEMVVIGNKYHCPNYIVDSIGIGQGIYDRVREVQPRARVISLNSAEQARDVERFANTRAEMWWYVMEQIQDMMIPYPDHEELRRQLTAVRFKVVNSNGRIQLEPKQDTRKRLSRSPDNADAYVMGLYGLKDTDPINQLDKWDDQRTRLEISHGAASFMAA